MPRREQWWFQMLRFTRIERREAPAAVGLRVMGMAPTAAAPTAVSGASSISKLATGAPAGLVAVAEVVPEIFRVAGEVTAVSEAAEGDREPVLECPPMARVVLEGVPVVGQPLTGPQPAGMAEVVAALAAECLSRPARLLSGDARFSATLQ